jgi:effector-binding domain-containing protein
MTYRITVETAAPIALAALRRKLAIREIAAAFRPALEAVRPLLTAHPDLRSDGRIVLLYHHPTRREDAMDVDFGVHVARAFAPEGEVFHAETPAGEVVTTTHIGAYEKLPEAQAAIHAWRAQNQRDFAGTSWEIYGAFNADPALNETQIMYLLA